MKKKFIVFLLSVVSITSFAQNRKDLPVRLDALEAAEALELFKSGQKTKEMTVINSFEFQVSRLNSRVTCYKEKDYDGDAWRSIYVLTNGKVRAAFCIAVVNLDPKK